MLPRVPDRRVPTHPCFNEPIRRTMPLVEIWGTRGPMEQPVRLPIGVRLMHLTTHADHRGELTEIIRSEWHESPPPVQWTVTRTGPNAMLGVHVHAQSWNYACVVGGELIVGLHDMRSKRPAIPSSLLRLSGACLAGLVIPPGVAHGFY